jgi:hypothetical protein
MCMVRCCATDCTYLCQKLVLLADGAIAVAPLLLLYAAAWVGWMHCIRDCIKLVSCFDSC